MKASATRFDNLQVINFSKKDTNELAKQADRSMEMRVNIQDGDVMVSVGKSTVYITPVKWKHLAHFGTL